MTTTPTEAHLITVQVDQTDREEFDEAFRAVTGMATPLPSISEAFMVRDDQNNVFATGYVHVQHLLAPWALTEDTPPGALTLLANAVTRFLRDTVREHITSAHTASPTETVGLAYDVYVPAGHAAPDGFERLPVEVWRKRVC